MFIYLIISFLLFISLSVYYYFEQKITIEDKLIMHMNQISKQYLNNTSKELPKKYSIDIQAKDAYPYPAFIKKENEYIHTSCSSLKKPDTILVIKAKKSILQHELNALKLKIFSFMMIAFAINLVISFILANISIQPIKEANNRFKNFVDDIIHDLNAPISAMDINIESLRNNYSEKKLQRIDNSVESIKNIYFNLESILQSQYKNKEEILQLETFCKNLLFQFKPLFADAIFTLNIPKVKIKINPFIFERIVVNIVQNSVKYSKHKPKIILGLDDKNRFFIEDNGVGMDDTKKLLHRGIQSNHKNQGYGLGLSIVQRLSEQLSIEFTIVSHKEKGTIFYFDLDNHFVKNEH